MTLVLFRLAVAVAMLLFDLWLGRYLDGLWPSGSVRKSHRLVDALLCTAGLSLLLWYGLAEFFFCAVYAGVLLLFRLPAFRPGMPTTLLFFSGGFGPFLILCAHGILIPLFSLLRGENMHTLVDDPLTFTLTLLVAVLCAGMVLRLCMRRLDDVRLRPLFACETQRRLVSGSLWMLFGYLLLENYVYTVNFPGAWSPWFHLLTSVIALASFLMLLRYGADVSGYIEDELKTRQIEKQLRRQMVHYRQYSRYVDELRTFKHDFRHMVETARSLLRTGAVGEAAELLGQMKTEMDDALSYTPFANHLVVDAILQECAGRCRERGIAFAAQVSLPQGLGLSELELCRIFGNLADNAFEACEQAEGEGRFLRFESLARPGWVTVQIRNSYSGTLTMRDGLPVTQKGNAEQHGLGLVSVRQLLERTGGFMQIETAQSGVFCVRLHFCAPEQAAE